jgi:glucose uptake protein
LLDILIALIPAVTWGSIVLVSVKLGGSADHQVLGLTIGALLFALGSALFIKPHLSVEIIAVSFISGAFWALGQKNQFRAVEYLGVSKAVPISTGMQLTATSLFGVAVFHEWSTTIKMMIGVSALVCIIAGVVFTSVKAKGKTVSDQQGQLKKGLVVLLVSTTGYLVYVMIIRWFEIDGWSAILPQAAGMLAGALLLTIKERPYNQYTIRNILSGIIWATGNIGLLLAIPRVGMATSFSLSQTGIIISTFGGIFLLGEKKSKRQMIFVVIGSVLIIAGGILLGFTKK